MRRILYSEQDAVMTDFNGFKGRAKKLDDVDLPRIGARIGVGEDELHAFLAIPAASTPPSAAGENIIASCAEPLVAIVPT